MPVIDLFLLGHSKVFDVATAEEAVVNLELERIPVPMNTEVSGKVTSGGIPVNKATVKVLDINFNPIVHTLTNEAGAYLFKDVLRPGEFRLTATTQGFLTADTVNFSLRISQPVTVNIELTEDSSRNNGFIYGHITDFITKKNIAGAIASLYQSDLFNADVLIPAMQTISNDDGQYLLCNVIPGNYFLVVSASGYKDTDPVFIEVGHGQITKVDFPLIINPDTFSNTISGIIKGDGIVLSNACVGLYRITVNDEVLVRVQTANNEGLYLFSNVSSGAYVVKAKLKSGLYFSEKFIV